MIARLKRWMLAATLDDERRSHRIVGRRESSYATELRALAGRLRREAPHDLTWPSRELRRRTLDAVRESYIFSLRRCNHRERIHHTAVSPRLIGALAACVILAGGFSVAVHRGGPELIDSVRNAFAAPVHHDSAASSLAERPPSEMMGVPVGDPTDGLAKDAQDTKGGLHGPVHPGDDPAWADAHEPKRPHDRP